MGDVTEVRRKAVRCCAGAGLWNPKHSMGGYLLYSIAVQAVLERSPEEGHKREFLEAHSRHLPEDDEAVEVTVACKCLSYL